METTLDHQHVVVMQSNPGESNAINPATAVNIYGVLSIVFASAFPLLWNNSMKSSTNFATTGYKVAAYLNLVSWSPFALVALFYWVTRADFLAAWIDTAMRFSVAGPWFFNIYVLYVIGRTGLVNNSTTQFLAFVGYLAYSFIQLVSTFALVPGVAAFSAKETASPTNSYRDYVIPEQDTKESPDMEDLSYLDDAQAEGGSWPTDSEA